MADDWFASVEIKEGNFLRKKELFEYTTPANIYDIELFQNQDNTFYAIGVPREGRIVVYGSAIVDDSRSALQTVIDKIHREGMDGQESRRQNDETES
jgi:hypothetical protein